MTPRNKPNARLSDAQVREIKLIGIAGDVSAGPVARLYQVGVETVRKIWRGETHGDVVVAGEEGIRGRGPLPARPKTQIELYEQGARELRDNDAEESAQRLLRELQEGDQDGQK